MNIHEHQAKQILKKYGAVVPEGVFALIVDELIQKDPDEFLFKCSDAACYYDLQKKTASASSFKTLL